MEPELKVGFPPVLGTPVENLKGGAPTLRQGTSPPRFLTVEEIEDIVDVVPEVAAATQEVAMQVRSQIKLKLALQLRDYRVCPDAIPKLKGEIINQFLRSVINPGEPIGITTGEAIGGPITQMTLNTFHFTGSAKSMSMGIDAFRELLNATKDRKHKTTTIHFKDKNLSFEEVLELRRTIVGVTIASLVTSHATLASFNPDGTSIPFSTRGWWYDMYYTVTGKELIDTRNYLRLNFNINALYSYQVTLDDIVRVLENNFPQVVKCVASPTSLGIIDVYPDEELVIRALIDKLGKKANERYVAGINADNADSIFIQLTIVDKLNQMLVKGVDRITDIFPISVTTWSVIRSEEPIMNADRTAEYLNTVAAANPPGGAAAPEIVEAAVAKAKKELNRQWILWLDTIPMRMTGIELEKIRSLLTLAGIEIMSADGSQIQIRLPENWEAKVPVPKNPDVIRRINPGSYVNSLLEEENNRVKVEIAAQRAAGVPYPVVEPSALHRAGNYVYADANGTNLQKLLAHRLIDSRRTISNDPHEIAATLGIGACRNYIARQFYDMISGSSSYVNSRYIDLIGDFMTNSGFLIPITSRGVARQNRGAFADASFEHSVLAFLKAATFGYVEKVGSVSTSIFTGKRALIGTGIMNLGLIEEVLKYNESKQEGLLAEERLREAKTTELGTVRKMVLDADAEFGGDTMDPSNGTDMDLMAAFDTPDPNGIQPTLGPVFRAPTETKVVAPAPITEVIRAAPMIIDAPAPILPGTAIPVTVPPPNLLAPKGPVPRAFPVSALAPAPWISEILAAANPVGLPPLEGFDVATLIAQAVRNPPPTEVTARLISVEAFLEGTF